MQELDRIIAEDSKKRGDIMKRLEEIQATEQVNEFGIMLNSILTVKIIEGSGFSLSGAIVVVLSVEG